MMAIKHLQAAEIELTPIVIEEIQMVRKWRNSPAISEFMYTNKIVTEEEQLRWFKISQNDDTKMNWIISCMGKKIGLAYLYNIQYDFDHCYWGFYIADNSIRGAGIGSKVEFIIIDFVFNELKLNKLICEVFVENTKVVKMHEKFGFRRESFFREHIKKDGNYRDVIGLTLLSNEWNSLRDFHYNRIFS